MNSRVLSIIKVCSAWYANEVIDDFHKRRTLNDVEYTLNRMNLAKRCCADDASLCEIISVAPEKESASKEFIENFLEDNRFDTMYRKQLEKTAATGTAGAYISLRGASFLQGEDGVIRPEKGKLHLNYIDAENIIPLTVENDQILECAFSSTNRKKGKDLTTLVIFSFNENGAYSVETCMFDDRGNLIPEKTEVVQLGEVKPFAIMQVAEVNNLKWMSGYGLPKIYNSIPVFKAADLCYNVLFSDLSKAEKVVLINELLSEIKDENGRATLTPQQKEIFVMLGERLPEENSLIQEYNPKIRIDEITKSFELVLSLISLSFGYGTRKYTLENGQIKTATEYIGEKQDCMQELNKQRRNAEDYISDIIHAAMWFSNTFNGTSYNTEEPLSIEFDDSYIEDRQAKLESMRADALSFGDIPILKVWYLMEKYNIPEEEARKYIHAEEDPIEDLED